MAVRLPTHRFTVADFERMIEAGILTEDDRVELIEGEVVEMAAIGRRHSESTMTYTHFFTRLAGDQAVVSVQNPLEVPATPTCCSTS